MKRILMLLTAVIVMASCTNTIEYTYKVKYVDSDITAISVSKEEPTDSGYYNVGDTVYVDLYSDEIKHHFTNHKAVIIKQYSNSNF